MDAKAILILIPLFLLFTLHSSFALNTTTTFIDNLDNTSAIITEDSIVGEKLEQVQNQSNATGNTIEDPGQKTNWRVVDWIYAIISFLLPIIYLKFFYILLNPTISSAHTN